MYPFSFADLRKDAQALLALINTMPRRDWELRLRNIFVSDDIQGLYSVTDALCPEWPWDSCEAQGL